MKNSNDSIGNSTRELSACSAVSQPTAPPHIPVVVVVVVVVVQSKFRNLSIRCQLSLNPEDGCGLSLVALEV
jgi:hypothetical protein